VTEARRAGREIINRYLRVFDSDTERFLGYLVDITPAGAMLQSREPIQPEVRMNLRVELPEDFGGARELRVEAESVWDKKEENALFHHTGFQFIRVPEGAEEHIRRLMTNYKLEGLSH